MLSIEHVTKKYGNFTALEDINLTFENGVYGLLAPNGAGKTTLIKLLATLLFPTEGNIYWEGQDILAMGSRYRGLLGYLPQEFGYYKNYSPEKFLYYMAALQGIGKKEAADKIDSLLELVALKDVQKKKLKQFSGGMIQRVGIAQAMLNDPKILVMDEPTAGLDPGERVRFRNFISEFSHDRIVLISTHIVSDIEYIATRNAIMKAGKIVDIGTTDELVKEIEGKVWTCSVPDGDLSSYEMRLRVINQRGEDNGQVSIRYLSETPEISGAVAVSPRLEDLYLWYFPQENLEGEGK